MINSLFSIVAGAIIAYLIARWQMKKNKIVHFSINSYDIGKGLSDEFSEFSIHYGKENLINNVQVLKGGFMNVGKNDINALNGKDDIKIVLPKDCHIKAINVKPSTKDLKVCATKNEQENNTINFGVCSDILKSDEYFEYTAIVETNKEINNLHDKLGFHHRILNTAPIQNTFIGELKRYRKIRIFKIMFLILFILQILSGIYSILFQDIHYKVFKHNNTGKEFYLYTNPSSELYISNNQLFHFIGSKTITKEELYANYSIEPETTFYWYSIESLTSIIMTLITILYGVFFYYSIWGKNSHIVSVIKKSVNESSGRE